jgi:hypothetical protein
MKQVVQSCGDISIILPKQLGRQGNTSRTGGECCYVALAETMLYRGIVYRGQEGELGVDSAEVLDRERQKLICQTPGPRDAVWTGPPVSSFQLPFSLAKAKIPNGVRYILELQMPSK